jgi:hypothetical protein
MRAFLSGYNGFFLAIPIEMVSSLLLYEGETEGAVYFDEERGNTYFSLPHLLKTPVELIRHGMVIKSPGGGEEAPDEPRNRNIFLTTGVERESDIPDEAIYPPPAALAGTDFAAFISGIHFIAHPERGLSPLLVLNCEFLVKTLKPRGTP